MFNGEIQNPGKLNKSSSVIVMTLKIFLWVLETRLSVFEQVLLCQKTNNEFPAPKEDSSQLPVTGFLGVFTPTPKPTH